MFVCNLFQIRCLISLVVRARSFHLPFAVLVHYQSLGLIFGFEEGSPIIQKIQPVYLLTFSTIFLLSRSKWTLPTMSAPLEYAIY